MNNYSCSLLVTASTHKFIQRQLVILFVTKCSRPTSSVYYVWQMESVCEQSIVSWCIETAVW